MNCPFNSDGNISHTSFSLNVCCVIDVIVCFLGSASQKGTVMGILRSLGALARALGPTVASSVYWLAGAELCFIISSTFFIVPLILLSRMRRQKEEWDLEFRIHSCVIWGQTSFSLLKASKSTQESSSESVYSEKQ